MVHFKSVLLSGVVLFSFFQGFAQNIQSSYIAANIKGGLFANEQSFGLSYAYELNYMSNIFFISLNYTHADDLRIISGPRPNEHLDQANFMIGKNWGIGMLRFYSQLGIGAIWGITRGKLIEDNPDGIFQNDYYEKVHFQTAGFPLRLGVHIPVLKYMSIGVDMQYNFNNTTNTFMPIMISIGIGKLQ